MRRKASNESEPRNTCHNALKFGVDNADFCVISYLLSLMDRVPA